MSVPIRRIAEKWIEYYWPILAASQFFPQIQGEGRMGAKELKFREPLRALMAPYAQQGIHGGLSAWALDANAGRLSSSAQQQLERTLGRIAQAIREGPVAHSGAQLEGGPVFAYDPTQGAVRMRESLWRELSLLGYWVIDAVILRWAELSERLGRALGIDAGMILPCLLARPDAQRSTAMAREVFLMNIPLRCVWTGRPIPEQGLAVDHVIPFSLWGNNDLWNLMPTLATINARKSDLLPTSTLLHRRRAAIVETWQGLRERLKAPFDRQARHLMGCAPDDVHDWAELLFARLHEMTELTAQQRGIRRWEA